jgi:hypothetical protein
VRLTFHFFAGTLIGLFYRFYDKDYGVMRAKSRSTPIFHARKNLNKKIYLELHVKDSKCKSGLWRATE